MYPLIPIDKILTILKEILDKEEDEVMLTKLEMTKLEFLDILKFYLENQFNGRIYKQDGLSVSAQTPPLLVNMVMDW